MAAYPNRRIVGASLGHCVHVAGVLGFLDLAEKAGYETHFLGPAVSVNQLVEGIRRHDPDMVAVGYRLTPDVLPNLLTDLGLEIERNHWQEKRFVFGGTPPAAHIARESNLFDAVFSGVETTEELVAFLEGKAKEMKEGVIPPQNLLDRIDFTAPHPILRHHYGRPTVEETVKGVREIALSETIDVISIGPDQNAQECFFRPDEMKGDQDGAGGVPLRKPEDLKAIYAASRCGNHPLLRCYSGTRDLIQWAEMSQRTIHIAWGAVPLFWYNQLDGRSKRKPVESIRENQETMKWYGERDIPLEVNESHHWSLRNAPDTVAVAAAYLAAYNAKKMGVKHYVAQYMFNTPAKTSPPMDLAKMLAKIELIESLHDEHFTTIRQTRAGLNSLSPDPNVAKGQLAASCYYQRALNPRIIHVVGFCEADHAATPPEIIESAGIIRGVIQNTSLGLLPMANSRQIMGRKEELVREANYLLQVIQNSSAGGEGDPLTDPGILAGAVKKGLLDAPHLCGNPHAAGTVLTQVKDGACVAVDLETNKKLDEHERISRVLSSGRSTSAV